MPIQRSGAVLGIDIGFSPTRRSSAACLLAWDESAIHWRIERFRYDEPERTAVIGRVAGSRDILAAAFDGPLRGDLAAIGHYRECERILTRGPIARRIGKPGHSSAPVGKRLNAATNEAARAVLTLCGERLANARHRRAIHARAIVEAFPSAFMGLMLAEPGRLEVTRNNRSDRYFEALAEDGRLHELLAFLLPGPRATPPLGEVRNHDDRAALICAITALCVAVGRFTAIGDADGWMILPPRRFIADWALAHLC